jgi:DAK2 domain fusion protein YloV
VAPPLPTLRPQDLKKVLQRYLTRLREYRDALNRLNVYPVPDGDTGTNMTLTVESVVAEVEGAESMADLAKAIAHGSLMGAQGNSGIILSQILRGLADVFRAVDLVDRAQLVEALDKASAAAYEAVGRPVEGTILTVLREAAAAAQETETPQGESLADLLRRVYRRAEKALEDTPQLLPVLKEAGVVDAGGAGLLLLLAAFVEEVTGEEIALPDEIFRAAAGQVIVGGGDDAVGDLRYEVMYLLEGPDGSGDRLREAWSSVGDSIVVVGGAGTWNCHVHTDDIGGAIEAGIAVGTPRRIKVTDLLEQAAEIGFHEPEDRFEPLPEFAKAAIGLVAVASGPGLIELFRNYGAQGMVVGGQTMNPSVGDLLGVVETVPSRTVVVLPNNKNVVPAAEELDALTTKAIHVVPTRSIPQGIAALLAYAIDGDPAGVADAMARAAEEVRTGELTRAVRDARTAAGAIAKGDWLGLIDGRVEVIAGTGRFTRFVDRLLRLVGRPEPDRRRAALQRALVRLLDGVVEEQAEVVTVITGEGADPEVTAVGRTWLEEHRPGVGVEVIDGGQPLYPYVIGSE